MRSPVLLDVPSLAEFLPSFEANAWSAVGAPKNTPAEIVDKLDTEIDMAFADPKIKARLADLGATPLTESAAAYFDRYVAAETEKWAKVIRAMNLKADHANPRLSRTRRPLRAGLTAKCIEKDLRRDRLLLIRHHRGRFNLDQRVGLGQRLHLDQGHGREIASHDVAIGRANAASEARYSAMSITYQVSRTTCSGFAPAVASTSTMFCSALRTCATKP